MRGANDSVSLDNGHDPGTVVAKVRFNDPHSVVWVRVEVGLAEFMNEGALDNLFSNRKRKQQMHSGNVDASCSAGGIVRPGVENHAILSRCHDTAGFPLRGTSDRLAVQSSEARRVARRIENSRGGVEDGNALGGFDSRAGGEWGCSSDIWVFSIKKKHPNKVFQVFLPYVSPELGKRCRGVAACCTNPSDAHKVG